MTKNIAWAVVFAIVASLLQSTLLRRLSVHHAVPDLALGILVFSSYFNGVMTGQLTGFFSGLALDFLSAAPLGLNAFVRTIVGALSGLVRGAFIVDTIFLPMMLCGAATALKASLLLLLHILFADGVRAYPLREPLFWAELALNMVIAPFLFALLRRFSSLLVNRKGI
ncbi:MAG: rod shape-determining protein MreD [Treponema sp.]|jgi:rod shape-determining protein MreD|nr:rod shape-determining protein MreD [Treponema sp.]